nr:hypothetical protein [Candidatus Krumholzibacteria bacterium]
MSVFSLSPSCPECGHGVSWRRRWFSNALYARWGCPQCGQALRFVPKTGLIIRGLAGIPMAIGFITLVQGDYLLAGALLLLSAVFPRITPVELDPKGVENLPESG